MTDPRSAVLAPVLCAALLLAGCGGQDGEDDAATTTAAPAPAATTETQTVAAAPAAAGCRPAEPLTKPDVAFERPEGTLDRSKRWTLELRTSCGPIAIRLDVRDSPKTTASVAFLARRGFYDGLSFHRVASSPTGDPFVIQAGDPLGTGEGDPGYSVTERPRSTTTYTRGVVAMAKTQIEDPGTSGSQFYVVTGEDAGLPPDYAVLGRVVGSLRAVDRIASVATDPPGDGRPVRPVIIERATVRSQ